ncbi:MAG: hypothetical protein M0Q51_14945 [Bacteroidales bacterium]|nr:hypothetical protein [Bacteroidales bacterium]
MKTVYDNNFNVDSAAMSVVQIASNISQFLAKENYYLEQKQYLVGFRQIAETFNITEEEFSYLSSKLTTDIGADFVLLPANKKLFGDKTAQLASEIEKNKESLLKIQENRFQLGRNFTKSLGLEEDKTYTLKDFYSILETEKRNISLFENYFNQIAQIIDLKDEDLLSEIDLQLTLMQKNLASLKTEEKNQYDLNRAEKEKKQAQAYKETNEKKYDRIKSAYKVLSSLNQSDGTQQLNSFFDSNLGEIIDIFRTIHVPREFKSLIFQDKQLFLIKENGQKRKITEISTGQRTALGLSIFISLNRQLKNGPNLMIFDDPVSHIDDLNALSFLDFLRFFILNEDRQIFFSTANNRLASLFEKKFEFLGENDFKKWELKR